jgi:hypothetical protein
MRHISALDHPVYPSFLNHTIQLAVLGRMYRGITVIEIALVEKGGTGRSIHF